MAQTRERERWCVSQQSRKCLFIVKLCQAFSSSCLRRLVYKLRFMVYLMCKLCHLKCFLLWASTDNLRMTPLSLAPSLSSKWGKVYSEKERERQRVCVVQMNRSLCQFLCRGDSLFIIGCHHHNNTTTTPQQQQQQQQRHLWLHTTFQHKTILLFNETRKWGKSTGRAII